MATLRAASSAGKVGLKGFGEMGLGFRVEGLGASGLGFRVGCFLSKAL